MYKKTVGQRIFLGKKKKTTQELEYRSQLVKKIFDWLTYKLYKLHKKINYKYVDVTYYVNEYKYV